MSFETLLKTKIGSHARSRVNPYRPWNPEHTPELPNHIPEMVWDAETDRLSLEAQEADMTRLFEAWNYIIPEYADPNCPDLVRPVLERFVETLKDELIRRGVKLADLYR